MQTLGRQENMLKYYVLVLVPRHGGGWRAHFPDFPKCRAEHKLLELAIQQATAAAAQMIQDLCNEGLPFNEPRSFEEIRADTQWAAERSIDWAEVIVSIVGVSADQGGSARDHLILHEEDGGRPFGRKPALSFRAR
jgi:predicted RNase H-like HicB family nuclease